MSETNVYAAELEGVMESKREYVKKGKAALKVLFVRFFEENPNAMFLFWNQYTPYFNDGEQCTFGINEVYSLRLNESLPKNKVGDSISITSEYVLDHVKWDEVKFSDLEEELEEELGTKVVFKNTDDEEPKAEASSDDDDDEEEEDEEEEEEETPPVEIPISYQNEGDLYWALQEISDIVEEVIGDHVQVVIGRDLEIKTRDYDHE
jgi:hypothetical protein